MANLLDVTVDPKLAKQIQKISARHRADEAERDRLVTEAVKAGGTLREVAILCGLSHPSVLAIVKRTKTDE